MELTQTIFVFWWFTSALVIFLDRSGAQAELVAAAIVPHGDFALDPTLLPPHSSERKAAQEVADAARSLGSWLHNTIQPDILLLSTPHGMALTKDFALYMGSFASGFVDLGLDLHEKNATVRRVYLDRIELGPQETQDLLGELQLQSVSGILSFADSEDVALRWGEVVPLLLLRQEGNASKAKTAPRTMILSHPLRRYTQPPPTMVPELLQLGTSIRTWANQRPERIAMLISSDLSHTHRADGPYGFSNASVPFDAAVGKWASNPVVHADALLSEATILQDRAKSCGYTGLVTLHGALVGNTEDKGVGSGDGDDFLASVLANQNATYYGMIVAKFERRRSSPQQIIQ